ncbi:hypothetical protein ACFVFD_33210 [Streptomyces fimicarius]|uniref:hypothetical protein n=1 Tax=Streptomyces griseus TaxID=1911 RepID=UPI0036B992AD
MVQNQDQGLTPCHPLVLHDPVVELGSDLLHPQHGEQMAEYVPDIELTTQPEPVQISRQHPSSRPATPGTSDPVGKLRSAQPG